MTESVWHQWKKKKRKKRKQEKILQRSSWSIVDLKFPSCSVGRLWLEKRSCQCALFAKRVALFVSCIVSWDQLANGFNPARTSKTYVSLLVWLQDFEALTPNLLARTIETVEGGGVVVLLLRSVSSLKQLYTLTMVRERERVSEWERMIERERERERESWTERERGCHQR